VNHHPSPSKDVQLLLCSLKIPPTNSDPPIFPNKYLVNSYHCVALLGDVGDRYKEIAGPQKVVRS
jgi:hypothetical protein